jgi:hypothetical protein
VAADEGEISSLGNREKSQVCCQEKWSVIAVSGECRSEKLYCFLMLKKKSIVGQMDKINEFALLHFFLFLCLVKNYYRAFL